MIGRQMMTRSKPANWLALAAAAVVGLVLLKELAESIPALRRYVNLERM